MRKTDYWDRPVRGDLLDETCYCGSMDHPHRHSLRQHWIRLSGRLVRRR